MPEENNQDITGKWCNKDNICYNITNDSIYHADEYTVFDLGYRYTIHNKFIGSYYEEGVIVSDIFEGNFGDVYYNLKENNLIMYLGGILFNFKRQ
jgi:hypothetical protein